METGVAVASTEWPLSRASDLQCDLKHVTSPKPGVPTNLKETQLQTAQRPVQQVMHAIMTVLKHCPQNRAQHSVLLSFPFL